MRTFAKYAPLILLVGLAACAADEEHEAPRPKVRGPGEPRRVMIDRILISFRGNALGIEARRTLEEARRLAHRVYERAKAGESFAELRDGYSDDRSKKGDRANGPYILMNYGIEIAPTLMEVPRMLRGAMGQRLGDVAFSMKMGDIALVDYDETAYPAGFEIIRCLMRDDRAEDEVARDLLGGRDGK